MKKLSQIRAWVEWQQSCRHAGTESFEYLLGLIDRMEKALEPFLSEHNARTATISEGHASGYTCACDWCKEANAALEELEQ